MSLKPILLALVLVLSLVGVVRAQGTPPAPPIGVASPPAVLGTASPGELAALLADRLVDRATRGARERLDAFRNGTNGNGYHPAASLVVRTAGLVIRSVLGLVPIIAFVGVAYLALALMKPDRTTQMVTLA